MANIKNRLIEEIFAQKDSVVKLVHGMQFQKRRRGLPKLEVGGKYIELGSLLNNLLTSQDQSAAFPQELVNRLPRSSQRLLDSGSYS